MHLLFQTTRPLGPETGAGDDADVGRVPRKVRVPREIDLYGRRRRALRARGRTESRIPAKGIYLLRCIYQANAVE
jgi:hypothetical protein